MKKIICLMLIVMMSATTAMARPLRSGVYIGTKAGVMRTEMKQKKTTAEDMVFPFAFELGLRIRHFRIEAEYTFATKAEHEKYEQSTDTIMVQVYYDIPFKSPIRPYVNAGIGRHETKVKVKNVYREDRKGTAWNIGGGVTWNLSNAVNMDIGYRFLDIGDLKTPLGTIKTKHHFAYIGWRYVF